MPLKGRLQEFSLPDLFQLIHFGKKNGTLVITNGEAKGYVCFRNGNVFFATHNWKRPPLGERLLHAGMITDEQLRQSLDLQSSSHQEQRLGNILCELGYLSRESLEVFVEEQIRDAVFNLLQWSEGKFDFDPDQIFPEEDIGLSMSTEDLILEGSRRMDEWYQFERKVPSLDSVFRMVPDPDKDASEMNLTSDEWLVIYHIDGESTVRDIIEKSGQSALVTCRAMYGLVTAGLVSLDDDASPAPAAEDAGVEDDAARPGEGDKKGRGTRRRHEHPWRARKGVSEQEEEQEVVSLGDEPEEDIIVEEIAVEDEVEDSRKWSADRWRRVTEPPEVTEEEETFEAGTRSLRVEEGEDSESGSAVTGPAKEGTPAPGQSLVDYYKSLALQEASDNDSIQTFRETEQRGAGIESAAESVDELEPVPEELQEEEVRIDTAQEVHAETAGDRDPGSLEPREIPFKWETNLAEHQVPSDREADGPVEDSLPQYREGTGGEAEGDEVEHDIEPVKEDESPVMEIDVVEAEAPELEAAAGDVEETDTSPVKYEEGLEEHGEVEDVVAGDQAGDTAYQAQAEPPTGETAAVREPLDDESEAPLTQETPTVEEAVLPSEEEIEKLLQVTPPSRELSREELLAFDQPTYTILDSRGARTEPDTAAPEEEGTTGGGTPGTPGATDAEVADTPREREAAASMTQQADDGGGEELGRIIQFGRPGFETGAEVMLEKPEPIIKSAPVERIATAEDLQVAFYSAGGQAAPEIGEGPERVASATEEVVPFEEIPLVFDATPPVGAEPELTDEPDAATTGVEVIGLEQTDAEVISVDAADSVAEAEQLSVAVAPPYLEGDDAAPVQETPADRDSAPEISPGSIDEVAAWDVTPAERVQEEPAPPEQGRFSEQAATVLADHVSEGYTEPPVVPLEEPLVEPVSPDGYEHLGTLRELSGEEPEVQAKKVQQRVEEQPEAAAEQAPLQAPEAEPELADIDMDDEGIMGPLKVSGKRDAGTSLIDLETLELEQELLELAGGETKKNERKPVRGKPVKKKERRGRGKSKGKEVDKGSVKKIIDDMKKM